MYGDLLRTITITITQELWDKAAADTEREGGPCDTCVIAQALQQARPNEGWVAGATRGWRCKAQHTDKFRVCFNDEVQEIIRAFDNRRNNPDWFATKYPNGFTTTLEVREVE